MFVRRLLLRNFMAFAGDHEIVLHRQAAVFVRGRNGDDIAANSNGSGKSSVFDALDWALYGAPPRRDSADAVINDKAGRDCHVIAHVEADDGTLCTIYRYRKVKSKNGCRAFFGALLTAEQIDVGSHDAVERTRMDASATQAVLDEFLGMDRSVFRAAVYRAQEEDWSFALATDAQRKEMLISILGLEALDAGLQRVKASANASERERVELLASLATVERDRGAAESRVAMLRDAIPEWDRMQAEAVERLTAQRVEARKAWVVARQAATRLAEVRAELAGMREPVLPPKPSPVVPTVQPFAATAFDVEIARAESMQHACATQLAGARAELTRAQRHRSSLRTGGACPTCGQAIQASCSHEQIAAAEAAVAAAEAAVAAAEAAGAEARPAVAAAREARDQALAAWHADTATARHAADTHNQHALAAHAAECARAAAGYDAQRTALLAEVRALGPHAEQLAHVEADGHRLTTELSELGARQNPHRASLAVAEADLAQALDRRAKLDADLATVVDRLRYLEFWTAGLGNQGLRSYVLDECVQHMTAAANRWVEVLTGGTTWVRFETQKMTQAGTLTDRLEIRVFRHNPDGSITERNMRAWSGGERRRIARGVDFGLRTLIAQRSTRRWDLLILDEAFAGLDDAGRRTMLDLMQQLQAECATVFVVEHDRVFESSFTEFLTVQKKDGASRILPEEETRP